MGTSQGGTVSAIDAARHKDVIEGVILLYPAFLIYDEIHRRFDLLDNVPDYFFFRWITLGRIYAEDIWDYYVISGAGHGFTGESFRQAEKYIIGYLKQIRILG